MSRLVVGRSSIGKSDSAQEGKDARIQNQLDVAPKPKNAVANYISETIAELKKVTWLSRRDLLYLSGIVLLVTVVVGVILGGIDFGFSKFIQWLINTVKGV